MNIKKCHIYEIVNIINNKKYIGITSNLKRRIRDHENMQGNCRKLYNAIAKYGWDNFEVRILCYGVIIERCE